MSLITALRDYRPYLARSRTTIIAAMNMPQLGSELDRDECLRLLSTTTVGRLIYTSRALPAVEPVRFILDEQSLVFRSTYAEKIEWPGESPVVAFQADQLDHGDRPGADPRRNRGRALLPHPVAGAGPHG